MMCRDIIKGITICIIHRKTIFFNITIHKYAFLMETIQAINCIIAFCRMYVIVEFALDGSVALINDKWMSSNREACMWPTSKSAIKIDKAVRSGTEPDSSFKAHECHVLYTSSK